MTDGTPLLDVKTRYASAAEQRIAHLRTLVGLLTEEDMELLLRVTGHTLQYWRQHSLGPAYAKLGKTIFYRIEDVCEWVGANIRSGTALTPSLQDNGELELPPVFEVDDDPE